MLVSFCVSSWTILQEKQATVVSFGLQVTSHIAAKFAKTLGLELNVYTTTLGDEDNVFITRNRFNQKGYFSVCTFSKHRKDNKEPSGDVDRSSMTANCDKITGQITTITGRINMISDDIKSALRQGCQVKISQVSPGIITVILDKVKQQHLYFPAPVLQAGSKCRIARQSSYVEVEALLRRPLWHVPRLPPSQR